MSDSFNPCSLGCFPRSVLLTGNEKIKASFNPCSLGCFPRRVNMMNRDHPSKRFQSLFSWMFSSKFARIRASSSSSCFNPCSLGCFPRSFSFGSVHFSITFQSLFSWMFSSKSYNQGDYKKSAPVSILVLLDVFLEVPRRSCFPVSAIVSFNPCSLGCFPRSLDHGGLVRGMPEFQSLFSWMFSSKG